MIDLRYRSPAVTANFLYAPLPLAAYEILIQGGETRVASRVARVPRSFPLAQTMPERAPGRGEAQKTVFSCWRCTGSSIVPAKSLALAPVSVFASLPLSLPLTRYGAITG